MKKITNSLLTSLFVLLISTVYGQTKKPATKPASKPASTTNSKPYTPPATKPATSTPAKPAPAPVATEQEDMQAQYDKLNGNSAKPASPATTNKPKAADKPYVRPSAGSSSGSRVADSPKPAKVAASKSKSSSSDEDSRFHVGLRGGVNLMTIAKANSFQEAGTTSLIGFHGGLVMNIGGKTLSVQPEILFSQIGVKYTDTGNSLQGSFNTVTVPLLLKLSFGSDSFRFFVTGGGFGSYLLSGSSSLTIAGQTSTESIKFVDGDRRLEYGATGGAGVQIGLGKMKLNLEGRYNYGLGGNEKVKDDAYSRTIMASVGVLIPL